MLKMECQNGNGHLVSIPRAYFRGTKPNGTTIEFQSIGETAAIASRKGWEWAEASKLTGVSNYCNDYMTLFDGIFSPSVTQVVKR